MHVNFATRADERSEDAEGLTRAECSEGFPMSLLCIPMDFKVIFDCDRYV